MTIMSHQFDAIIDNQPFKVRGLFGKFAVIGGKWRIHHFSTFASSNNESAAGNTKRLLSELKPMRERVAPSEIKDMSSLLQRDLDDARVANELIPYLLTNKANIGFFPAVLCAMLPKCFLSQEKDVEKGVVYPDGVTSEDGIRSFENYWSLKVYDKTAFAELTIDPSKTDIIVLDGQHRSNAFRFLTKSFATDAKDIHSHFYRNIDVPDDFDAELPVTIIWFERINDLAVDPKLISRRLFVDVNTTARKVHDSRNILLNDQSFSNVFTGLFYSKLAECGFDHAVLSLLHGAFDSDSEKNRSALSICSPTVIEYAFRSFCLGQTELDNINPGLSRDFSPYYSNTDRIKRIISDNNNTNDNAKALAELSPGNQYLRQVFKNTGSEYAYKLLSQFPLSAVMIKATQELNVAINSVGWKNSTRTEVWNKVYCGGEGLFSSFVGSTDATIKAGAYVTTIYEIEAKFKNIRRDLVKIKNNLNSQKLIEQAFETYGTKASITGLLMSLSKVHQKLGWNYQVKTKNGVEEKHKTIDWCIKLLNGLSTEQWVYFLTEFKSRAIGNELKPLYWPRMRNMYLIVIQDQEALIIDDNKKRKLNFFDNNFDESPDYNYVQSIVKEKTLAYKKLNSDQEPNSTLIRSYFDEAECSLKNLLKKVGLKSIRPAGHNWTTIAEEVQIVKGIDELNAEDFAGDGGNVSAPIQI